ncbi:hypothetical protein DLAC_06156 [Tieghemostelium lacteum]|uniref:Uncharacterized protein n=1 Tax=Tieghemostelium lacteum TaxID=361077 RepID=A0A151ZHZ1_TIELA|nr:hypothetical protein DLAC_06156 [Tieghemostelium lacteum]|eukprot:KYQ93464.1 hypothetical protein DLAC_06156 [Tieghemostelium lacteum]
MKTLVQTLFKRNFSTLVNNNHFSIRSVLSESINLLKQSENVEISEGCELESKILLSHSLGVDNHNDLYTKFKSDYQIPLDKYQQLRKSIERRLKNEPISYIVGYKHFWKYKFKCNTSTLIPRPDSETLIEAVLDVYSGIENKDTLEILDLGTGTGCLLLTLLKEIPNAKGVGVDQSIDAINVAKDNAKSLEIQSTRCQFIQADWNQPNTFRKDMKFDIIISNPPYISDSDYQTLSPSLKYYEPKSALVANDNGYQDYQSIGNLIKSLSLLKPNGYIFLEIGKDQHDKITSLMNSFGYKLLNYRYDLCEIIRTLIFIHK